MNTSIQCTNPRCHEAFTPSAKQAKFIAESAAKGMAFIMLECPACGSHSPVNPLAPDGAVETRPDRKSTRLNSSHIPLSRMPSSA